MKLQAFLLTALLMSQVASAQPQEAFPPIDYDRAKSWSEHRAMDRGPLVCDVTGDGTSEIMVVANYNSGSTEEVTRILVYSQGQLLTTLFMPANLRNQGFRFTQTPAVADADGDGNLEVIAGAYVEHLFGVNQCEGMSLFIIPCSAMSVTITNLTSWRGSFRVTPRSRCRLLSSAIS